VFDEFHESDREWRQGGAGNRQDPLPDLTRLTELAGLLRHTLSRFGRETGRRPIQSYQQARLARILIGPQRYLHIWSLADKAANLSTDLSPSLVDKFTYDQTTVPDCDMESRRTL
jgi:hypothetical protein